ARCAVSRNRAAGIYQNAFVVFDALGPRRTGPQCHEENYGTKRSIIWRLALAERRLGAEHSRGAVPFGNLDGRVQGNSSLLHVRDLLGCFLQLPPGGIVGIGVEFRKKPHQKAEHDICRKHDEEHAVAKRFPNLVLGAVARMAFRISIVSRWFYTVSINR